MNVRDLLQKAGYDIVKETITPDLDRRCGWCHRYDIRFNVETKIKKGKEIARGSRFIFDVNATHTVELREVGFNGHGDLYVFLDDVTTGECFDTIEFKKGELIE